MSQCYYVKFEKTVNLTSPFHVHMVTGTFVPWNFRSPE